VRVVSLDPQDCLQPLSMQALPAAPESLCVIDMAGSGEAESSTLYVTSATALRPLSTLTALASLLATAVPNNAAKRPLTRHLAYCIARLLGT